MSRVDARRFYARMSELEDLPDDVWESAGNFFIEKTPRQSGNAQRRTRVRRRRIEANYPYAQRLDEGWSKQAPRGMSEPTLDHIESEVDRLTRRI